MNLTLQDPLQFEIAPEANHKFLSGIEAELYCWSLVIDGKRGWRLPTNCELRMMGLKHVHLHMATTDVTCKLEYKVIPVRDVT